MRCTYRRITFPRTACLRSAADPSPPQRRHGHVAVAKHAAQCARCAAPSPDPETARARAAAAAHDTAAVLQAPAGDARNTSAIRAMTTGGAGPSVLPPSRSSRRHGSLRDSVRAPPGSRSGQGSASGGAGPRFMGASHSEWYGFYQADVAWWACSSPHPVFDHHVVRHLAMAVHAALETRGPGHPPGHMLGEYALHERTADLRTVCAGTAAASRRARGSTPLPPAACRLPPADVVASGALGVGRGGLGPCPVPSPPPVGLRGENRSHAG